jgi:hypothetical protein
MEQQSTVVDLYKVKLVIYKAVSIYIIKIKIIKHEIV